MSLSNTSPGPGFGFGSAALPAGTLFLGYQMNPDGSNQVTITGEKSRYGQSWSPDGNKIAITIGDDPFVIYTIDSDGSNQTRLTSTTVSNWQPDW